MGGAPASTVFIVIAKTLCAFLHWEMKAYQMMNYSWIYDVKWRIYSRFYAYRLIHATSKPFDRTTDILNTWTPDEFRWVVYDLRENVFCWGKAEYKRKKKKNEKKTRWNKWKIIKSRRKYWMSVFGSVSVCICMFCVWEGRADEVLWWRNLMMTEWRELSFSLSLHIECINYICMHRPANKTKQNKATLNVYAG